MLTTTAVHLPELSNLGTTEDVMGRRWSNLSDRSRVLIIAGVIAEAILKTAVLIDIRRRPASQIRGSKRMWIVVAVLVNSAGVGPISYFAFGRRRPGAGGPTAPGSVSQLQPRRRSVTGAVPRHLRVVSKPSRSSGGDRAGIRVGR